MKYGLYYILYRIPILADSDDYLLKHPKWTASLNIKRNEPDQTSLILDISYEISNTLRHDELELS